MVLPYLEHSHQVLQCLRGRSNIIEEPLGKMTRKMDKNGPRKGKAVKRYHTYRHRLGEDPKNKANYFEIWPTALLTPDTELKIICTLAKYCQYLIWDIRTGLEAYKL